MKTIDAPERDRGFTLIEILLAVSITAIVMTTVTSAFLGILQAREEVRALSDSTSAGPRILTLIERDLQGLWHFNIRGNKVFLGSNRDISGFPADRLDFLTTTNAIGAIDDGSGTPRNPTICEVGYWLKENDRYSDLRELWRREDPMVDDDLRTGGTFQLVHDRIKSFEITYFKTLGAKAEPLHEWDSSLQDELPRRIRIEFTVERTLPNRNRVSGLEAGSTAETMTKYTRDIVFDRRYPDILKAGIAMIPVLPPPPQGEQEAPLGGGGGGPPAIAAAAGPGPGPGGPNGAGGGVVAPTRDFNRGGVGGTITGGAPITTQTGGGGIPTGTPPPPPININDLLRGGGSGGGLFGSGGPLGGGRRR